MTVAAAREDEGEFIYLPLLHIMSPPCTPKHTQTHTYRTQDTAFQLCSHLAFWSNKTAKKNPKTSGLLMSEPRLSWGNKAGQNHTTVYGEAGIDCRV